MLVGALTFNLAVLVAAMLLLWAISVRIGDVSFIDSFWAYGMVLLAGLSYVQAEDPGMLGRLLFLLTAVWGLRLGTHLFFRWRREGMDPRYKRIIGGAMEKQGWSFARAALWRAWAVQIPLLFLVASPAQVGILQSDGAYPGLLAMVGMIIATTGILFETIGDAQLHRFRNNPANRGKVLDTGLWRYTRHPNYFGDFCAWWGIWLVAAETGWAAWITIIGPIFLSFTLMKWSGKPLLEKGMAKTRPDYAAYVARTSGFFPWFPRA